MSTEFDKNISNWRYDCTDHKNGFDFFMRLVKWPKIAVKKVPKSEFQRQSSALKIIRIFLKKFFVEKRQFRGTSFVPMILCNIKIERLLFLKFLKIWLFLTAIFGHLAKSDEKIKVIFVISAIMSSIWNVFIKFHWHDEKLTYYTQGNLLHCHLNNVVAGFATNFAPLWNHKMNFIKLKKSYYQKSGWNETWIFWYDFGDENQN